MKYNYSLKQQRDTFLLTIKNDLVLKAQDKKEKYFEQIGAGRTAFKQRWDSLLFRAAFNLTLPLIMLFLDLFIPLCDSVKLLLHKRIKLPYQRLFIGHSRQLYAITKRANLQKEGDCWFRMEDQGFILPEEKPTVTVFDFVRYGEIIKATIQAFIIHMRTVFRFGYDKYFLSYKAYEWCLTDFALRHVPESVELYYCFICDRNAILIDKLPHKEKKMIQHGTMHFGNAGSQNPYMEFHAEKGFYLWSSLYKSSPSAVYCYADDDEWALRNSVIANNPDYIHIGYGFTPAFKPEKKSVLIIANYNFYAAQEEEIIKSTQDLDVVVYLKNHPALSNSLYDELRRKYQFVFIEGIDTKLPDVDLVISYDSTLAYEYASIGTKVLYYGRYDDTNIRSIVKESLNISE